MRHKNGEWAGYRYEWNDSETGAFLRVDAKDKDVNGQRWHDPCCAQCMQCHAKGAGRALGLTG